MLVMANLCVQSIPFSTLGRIYFDMSQGPKPKVCISLLLMSIRTDFSLVDAKRILREDDVTGVYPKDAKPIS